jgi:hypothetical protein
MNMKFLFTVSAFFFIAVLFGQIKFDMEPKSFAWTGFNHDLIPSKELPAINVQALMDEDEMASYNAMRSGITKPLDLSMDECGRWYDLSEGGRIWLMKFRAPNSKATSIYLKDLVVPDGGYLSFYSPDKKHIRGAFDSRSFKRGVFTHDDIPGEEVIMEVYEPANKLYQTTFTLNSLCYMYIMPEHHVLKTSGACNVDVSCSEGTNWSDMVKSVVRIKTYKGGWVGWCSGSLMNNTAQDCRAMILTAWHCGMGNGFSDPTQNDLDNYIFYFNYERSSCGSGFGANDQMLGCSMLGNSQDVGGDHGSDFMLVELSQTIPWSYDVYYAGWDATGNGAFSGVSIHHPSGDFKKVSTYTSALISDQYGTATGSHWRVQWVSTTNGFGVTEGGSSGSPLFNTNGKVMGQLTGGGASCASPNSPDLYGKMSYNWNSNIGVGGDALKTFLDPSNSGLLELVGTPQPCLNNLNEGGEEIEFSVYPNPSRDILTIKTTANSSYQIEMISIDGKIVLSESVSNVELYQMNVSVFTRGMYLLNVKFQNGNLSKKIVLD